MKGTQGHITDRQTTKNCPLFCVLHATGILLYGRKLAYMARYFPRTPGSLASSPLSADGAHLGQELEERMRRLVAEQMALSVTRGASPRGAYQKDTPAAKPELWQMAGVTPSGPNPGSMIHQAVLPGGIHSNPSPRGAAHVRSNSQDRNRRRRSSSITALSRPSTTNSTGDEQQKPKKVQEKKVVLETVLGIYPAENKLPPGRSAADDFAATLAKRFQFGRKNNAGGEGPGSDAESPTTNPIAPNFSSSMAPPRPPRPDTASPKPDTAPPTPNTSAIAESARTASEPQERQDRRMEDRGSSRRRPSKARSKSRRRVLEQQPEPINERVYARMPLPAVPPSPAKTPPPPPRSDLKVDEERAGLSFPPQYGIDIADWAESVYIFPKTPFSESPDPAAMADFPMQPLSPSLCGSLPEEKRPSPPVPPVPSKPPPAPGLSQISGHSGASSKFTEKRSRSPPLPSTDYRSTTSLNTYQYDTMTVASVSEDNMPTTAAPSIAATNSTFFAAPDLRNPGRNSTVSDGDYDYLDFYKHDHDNLEDPEDYHTSDIYDHYSSREFIAPPVAVADKKMTERQPQKKKEAFATPPTKSASDTVEKKATKTTKEKAAVVPSAQDLDAEIAAYLAEWRRAQQKEREVAGGGAAAPKLERGDEQQKQRDWERSNARRDQLKPPPSLVSRRPSERLQVFPPAYGAMF